MVFDYGNDKLESYMRQSSKKMCKREAIANSKQIMTDKDMESEAQNTRYLL